MKIAINFKIAQHQENKEYKQLYVWIESFNFIAILCIKQNKTIHKQMFL